MESQEIKINTLEVNYKNMAEKIDRLETTVKEGFDKMMTKLEDFTRDADQKYARKYVEKEIKDIQDRKEARNFHWLSYAVSAGIGVLITILGYFFLVTV